MFFCLLYVSLYHDLHEEWPLGKLFRPSVIIAGLPVQLISGLALPSGKHLQKKSGLGLPRKPNQKTD